MPSIWENVLPNTHKRGSAVLADEEIVRKGLKNFVNSAKEAWPNKADASFTYGLAKLESAISAR